MCGITGFLDYKKQTSESTLREMTDVLKHRGPDDSGYEIFENANYSIGLGQRRLSILDLSPLGHQPMLFEQVVINFNGEIYNFREIRNELIINGYSFNSESDTEVLIKGYHCWGLKMLQKLTGMFSISLYDKKLQKLFLIRDRAGVKPLYYFSNDNILLFGSELKALYKHPHFVKEIDINSVALFLQFSYIPGPHTVFKNTFKLQPGHILTIDLSTSEKTISKYWDVFDYYNKEKLELSDSEAILETDKLLKKAYEYRMVADVPVGIFLSGGYDSSSVAALLQTGRTERLKTFTIGFHENEFNEAPEAKKIAEYLGTDHTEWYLTSKEAAGVLPLIPEIYDEPFADNSTVPTVLVSKLASKQVKVALSADGGDEIFGGYHKFNQAKKLAGNIPVPIQKILSGTMSLINPEHIPVFRSKYNFSTRFEKMKLIWAKNDPVQAVKYISQYITESEVEKLLAKPFCKYHTAFEDGKLLTKKHDIINNLLAIDYKTFLVDNNLVKVDRATMSVGLEGREPMIDHQLIEFVAQLPSSFKIRDGINKWILKEIVHQYIPKSLMERPKKPFIAPLMEWFRKDLEEQLCYYLSEKSLSKSGIFAIGPVIKLRDDYLKGKKVNYQKLWQILVFQLWYSRWINKL